MHARYRSWLITLNIALVGALAAVMFVGDAFARQGSNRPRGEYTLVGGESQGIAESVIWIVDATNQELLVLRWQQSDKSLKGVGFRDLAEDSRRAEGDRR